MPLFYLSIHFRLVAMVETDSAKSKQLREEEEDGEREILFYWKLLELSVFE